MNITALLPMKGNSERVPNKNMKPFGGKPLYHAIFKTLAASRFIDFIAINTDSDIIAEDAREAFGEKVKIIDRPESIQGDFVSMNDIIKYDLTQLDSTHFIQTHSTNPLLLSDTLDEGIQFYFDSLGQDCDSVFSVTRLQARLYDKGCKPINHNPNELRRTQDLDPLFEENSNFYIFSREAFAKADEKRIGLRPKLFEVNKLEAVDIDEPEDFVLAELLYNDLRK
ncbi:acylneuraminate cytidylyltransferase family protein [Gilvimarinus sp. 1_MG-2023]|uniref:acylneuraminate cytidylyltransferase family protein n=1 Tax=Gilvimarinus sp. 1_MG-2023 TaxID=3062638 RepID=UPI0026E177A5|nr:acylneuraminate cytidylyltransferase family protein [Gilvimarinus sp. 1_MG-2023]MDO6746295.1 acylneuraminate cytidylyltransferase family protein [Gilvimarinus sp. 1_MG-2023]